MTPDALDITIAIILMLSAIIAYFRGLIREVFTIVALIAATGASYFAGALMIGPFESWLHVDKKIGQQAADAVSKAAASGADVAQVKTNLVGGIASPEIVAKVCAYSSVFLFIYLVMSLVGFFLSRSVNESGLGIVDRLLGAGFGLARGFLLVFLFFLPVSFLIDQDKMPEWAKNSVSVPVLEKSVAFVDDHFHIKQMIEERGGQLAIKIGHKIDPNAPDPAPQPEDKAPPEAQKSESQKSDAQELKSELTDEERNAHK